MCCCVSYILLHIIAVVVIVAAGVELMYTHDVIEGQVRLKKKSSTASRN